MKIVPKPFLLTLALGCRVGGGVGGGTEEDPQGERREGRGGEGGSTQRAVRAGPPRTGEHAIRRRDSPLSRARLSRGPTGTPAVAASRARAAFVSR